MVYESDFYTTRRPYTRPVSSSYTVTDPVLRPISPIVRPSSPSVRSISPTTQVRRIPHLLPYIAHKRLVTVVHTPIHSYYYPGTPLPIRIHSRVRPSVLQAELQRIRELPRPSHESYTSNYLNSKDHVLWDDETREIRARADALLRRIHVFVPRPVASDFAEDIVPERMHSDDYIRRLLGARKNAKKDEEPGSYYESPEQRHFGAGNLACVAYTGGKPHSRRRPYYKLADLRPADVQSDVNMLSYYAKNRQAAASAYPDVPMSEREIRKARALEDDEPPRAKRATRNEPEVEAIVEEEVLSFRPARVPITEPEPEVKAPERKVVIDEKPIVVESEPELIAVPEPQVQQPEPEPIVESEPEVIAEPEPEVIAEPEPEVIAEPEPKVVAEPEPEVIAEPEPKVIAEPQPKIIAEPEPEAIAEPETEVVLEPEVEPIIETKVEVVAESEPQAIIEPEVVPEPEVQSPVEAEPEPIPQEESAEVQEPELKVESEAETIPERETEVTSEPQVQELETSQPEPAVEAPADEQQMVNEDNIVTNNEEVDDDVLQRKLNEDDLRRQVEELKRQAEAEERRRVEEARLAEERWKEQEEERQKREREAAKRRLAEIEEQERLEAERKTEEERWEAERIRDAKLAEIEKRAAEFDALLANEEENRYAIEKATEEAHKRQEREERLAAEVILGTSEDLHHPDGSYNECQCHPEVNSQEIEERPESPDAEDDTQIEEEECGGETDHDDASDPFIVEHEGFNSAPAEIVDAIDDGPVLEESSSNVDNFWGDNDD